MADDAHSRGVKGNLSQGSTWLRLVYMLVLAVAWVVTEVIFIAVIVLQFLAKLFTGHPLKHLTAFGGSLADYMAQIVRFETFVTEDLAFPFVAWPSPANEKPATVSPPQLQEQSTETGDAKPQTDSDTEGKPKKKPRTRRTRKTETPK
ncbi:MAG: DUF4389 domain-containing protein [Geminicoccaceae bacterium]